jgi:preprotein translocase subunit SecB
MPKTQLKPSPLQLLSQDTLEISITASERGDDFGSGNIEVDREVERSTDDANRWAVMLDIELQAIEGEAPPPYTGHIKLVGFYQVHEEYKGDSDRLIRITGASMLYGAAREMVSYITARSPNGMLTLPSVSFYEESPKKKATKKVAKKKTSAKKDDHL